MNEEIIWAKSILTVYRYLDRVAGGIDKVVLRSGLASGNVYGRNYLTNNVFSISQKIIDLSERKVVLINLKVLTENILKKMKLEDVKILLERYVEDKKYKEVALSNNISLRTVSRRLDSIYLNFSRLLVAKGYTPARLKEMLANEAWILDVFTHIKNKNEDFSISDRFLAKAVSM